MRTGKIIQVSGSVVDVRFPHGELPRIREALSVELNGKRLVMEVEQHLSAETVRCIMLSASEGLGKGMASLVISLCRYIIFIMPIAWVLCGRMGPTGVWHAFWITEALSAVIAYAVYHKAVHQK